MWTHMDNTWFRNPLPANFNIYPTQVWVFGMISETTRKVKIFIVDSRDNQRLGKLEPSTLIQVASFTLMDGERMMPLTGQGSE